MYRTMRSIAYGRIGEDDKTLEDLNFILANVPDTLFGNLENKKLYFHTKALENRSLLYMTQGLHEKAKEDLLKLLLIDSNEQATIMSSLATVCSNLNQNEESNSYIEEAYRLDSNDTHVVGNRGMLCLDKDRNKAIYLLTRAIKLERNQTSDMTYGFYMSRGLAYDQEKQYSFAESDFKKSIELNPKNIDTYLFYAAMLKKQGRKEEYCENLNKAVALGKVVDSKFLGECNGHISLDSAIRHHNNK